MNLIKYLILVIPAFSLALFSKNLRYINEESLASSQCSDPNYYLAFGIGSDYLDKIKAYSFKDSCPSGWNDYQNPLPENKRELEDLDLVYKDEYCISIVLHEFPCACQEYEIWRFQFEKIDGTIISQSEISHYGYLDWYVFGIHYYNGLPSPCFLHDLWSGIAFYNNFTIPCQNLDFIILKFLYFSGEDNNWILLREWDIEIKPARDRAKVNASSPYIPSRMTLQNGRVLTKSDADALIYNRCDGLKENFIATIISDRNLDIIMQDDPQTDRYGKVYADITTWDQVSCPTQSKISINEIPIEITKPSIITWLPVEWEDKFNVTCYNTPRETDFTKGPEHDASYWNWCYPLIMPNKKFNDKFMEAVKMNGNGEIYLEDGSQKFIRWEASYNPPCFHYIICPLTAKGECAVAGQTVAIDRQYSPTIPFDSLLNIDQIGNRTAEDSGGTRIRGYDIDVYNGIGASTCFNWPKNWRLKVTLLNY